MTIFELFLNGRARATAEVQTDAGVLTGVSTGVRKKDREEEIFLLISGRDSNTHEDHDRGYRSIKPGDEPALRIAEGEMGDAMVKRARRLHDDRRRAQSSGILPADGGASPPLREIKNLESNRISYMISVIYAFVAIFIARNLARWKN